MPQSCSAVYPLFMGYATTTMMQQYQYRIRIERELLREHLEKRNERLENEVRELQEEAYFRLRLHTKRIEKSELEINNAFFKELSSAEEQVE